MVSKGDKEEMGAVREAYYREYDTLRQESMQSMGNRTQIVAFGLGTIGVLMAATLTAPARPAEFVWLMFNFAVPAVSLLVFVAWFAEFERMVRAGRYLQQLEDAINATLVHSVLSWERDLEKMRMGYAYVAVAALFLGLAAGGPLFGFWLQDRTERPTWCEWLAPPSSGDGVLKTPWVAWVLALAVASFLFIRVIRRLGRFAKSVVPRALPERSPEELPEAEREILDAARSTGWIQALEGQELRFQLITAGRRRLGGERESESLARYWAALQRLEQLGLVEHVHGALYRLTASGFASARLLSSASDSGH